jgi:hypothetical protein
MRRAVNSCPECGATVSYYAAGCAVCGAVLPPYEERHRVTPFDDLRVAVVRAFRRARERVRR